MCSSGPFSGIGQDIEYARLLSFVGYIIYWQRAGENPSINVGDLHQQLQ